MDELQTVWGVLPALYLFLAGAAAGTFFVSAVLQIANDKRYGRVSCVGFIASLGLLGAGLSCLVAETEKPLRALLLPVSFTNIGSWMTIGAWLLLAASLVFAAAGALSLPRIRVVAGDCGGAALRAASAVGSVLAVGVAAYSAMLLMAAPAVPLWSSPVLVAVFLASAASMGVAIVSGIVRCVGVRDDSEDAGPREPVALRVALVAAPLVELCAVAAFLGATAAGGETQQRSFGLITTGPLATEFWVGAVVVGIVVPAIIAAAEGVGGWLKGRRGAGLAREGVLPTEGASGRKAAGARLVALRIAAGASCACSLVGAFCLRSVIVAAGVHAALAFPVATAAAAGLTL